MKRQEVRGRKLQKVTGEFFLHGGPPWDQAATVGTSDTSRLLLVKGAALLMSECPLPFSQATCWLQLSRRGWDQERDRGCERGVKGQPGAFSLRLQSGLSWEKGNDFPLHVRWDFDLYLYLFQFLKGELKWCRWNSSYDGVAGQIGSCCPKMLPEPRKRDDMRLCPRVSPLATHKGAPPITERWRHQEVAFRKMEGQGEP